MKKEQSNFTVLDPSIYQKPKQQKPSVRQTLVAAVITSSIAIILIVTGICLKLAYWHSLYYKDEYYWLAVTAMVCIALSIPIGVTAVCLINVICRVRAHIAYMEARKRELESRVADVYVPEVPLKN
ncbi:hypothetical protein T265_08751 [Opisthorchis viverrini]|uniref:Transmembrane protein n=1 Tax=Opisthorchis viverrini TaxID=6198 RepID=A0A075A7B4_OPIVI|nr:hypothetical protein T265_08751 [Opisthorchis viverrini]KER23339.1 hypothetical protein T265_08751 [Opisthorchis viverrini]